MYPVRPDELLLIVHGRPAFPGDLGVLFILGHTVDGVLYVAPMGSGPLGRDLGWAEAGPIGALPHDHALGDLAGAWRRAVAACN